MVPRGSYDFVPHFAFWHSSDDQGPRRGRKHSEVPKRNQSRAQLTSAIVSAVRSLIFSLSWVLLGKRYWFLPNIFSDDVTTVKELLQILPTKDEEASPKWSSRLLAAILAAAFVWILARHGPGEDERKKMTGKVKNTLHEWLEWNPAQLGGNVTEAGDVFQGNGTERGNLSEGIGKAGVENLSEEQKTEAGFEDQRDSEETVEGDQQRHEL